MSVNRLDKYVFLAFVFVTSCVILHLVDGKVSDLADLAMVFIAAANLWFVFTTFRSAQEKEKKELGKTLMPLSIRAKRIRGMLVQYGSDPRLTPDQISEFRAFTNEIKVYIHLMPEPISTPSISVLENASTLIGYSIMMNNTISANARNVVYTEKPANQNPFLHKCQQWLWENRDLEADKVKCLEESLQAYFN